MMNVLQEIANCFMHLILFSGFTCISIDLFNMKKFPAFGIFVGLSIFELVRIIHIAWYVGR